MEWIPSRRPVQGSVPILGPSTLNSLVEGSPSIALDGLKKAIRSRRLAQAGREEREKEARERWGLELVMFIKEAELPCAERMQAMGGQNSQWLRLFGNRRSKTLRNRAMSWKGFRAWQQVAKGEVWPGDVGCFLKYLEERHEVQPLGKTTPGALLSSLALLESVGQVPSSDRLSHDSMLLESVRSWQAELEAGAMPPKQAPTSTVSIMLACELVARKSSLPVGYRTMEARYEAGSMTIFWTQNRALKTTSLARVPIRT